GLEELTPGLCGHGTKDSVRFARRSRRDCAAARGLGLNRSHTPALAVGIGAVAGLRTLTAPAVLAWAAQRRWIRMGNSPFVTIISARASKQITNLAVSELIADKLS